MMESQELLRRSEALMRQRSELERSRHSPPHLQPGEDPTSTYLEDAMHWVHVYEELVKLARAFQTEMTAKLSLIGGEAAGDGLAHAQKVLELDAERMQLHLSFWRERTSASSCRIDGGGDSV